MRAKFQCNEVANLVGGTQVAKLNAVYADGTNEEDNQFNQASPQGTLEIYIDNPAAKDYLKPGKKYYLDFSEAPD